MKRNLEREAKKKHDLEERERKKIEAETKKALAEAEKASKS